MEYYKFVTSHRKGVIQYKRLQRTDTASLVRSGGGKTEVSVAGFAAGMYILQIQAGDKTICYSLLYYDSSKEYNRKV